MKTLGIVCVKSNSNRFPNKNIHPINEIPLFWYSVQPLLHTVDKVVVYTDSAYVMRYCNLKNVEVIKRGTNSTFESESIFDSIKSCYKALNERYGKIVSIMANCPFHKPEAVLFTLERLNNCKEVRSFTSDGIESGILGFTEEQLLTKHEVSTYIECVVSNVKEIHYLNDLLNS